MNRTRALSASAAALALLAGLLHGETPAAASSGYATVVEDTPGLVSYWRLDTHSGNVAADAVGANRGTYVGTPGSGYVLSAPSLIAQSADTATQFGADGGVSIPASASLKPGAALTVEAWVKAGGRENDHYVAAEPGSWRLRFDSNGYLTFGVYGAGGTEYQANSGRGLSAGYIRHLVGTYDGHTIRLYLDGVEVAATTHTGAVPSGSLPDVIAYNGGTSSTYHYTGTVDEVAYYNAALSPTQVRSHWDAGSQTTTSSCAVPYATSSPWNTPIAANAPVDPSSAVEIASLTRNTPYPKLGSDPTQYTMPLYLAGTGTAKVPVYVASTWSNVTAPATLARQSAVELQLPIPAAMQPAAGSDSQAIVWNPQTGDEWGFWQLYNSADTLSATMAAGTGGTAKPLPVNNASSDFWVGEQIVIGRSQAGAESAVIASFPDASHMALRHVTTNAHAAGEVVWGIGATNGYHYNTTWSGVPPSGFGSRGAGVPYLAGLARPCEVAQGHIDHALAFAYQNTTSRFVSPATKSDGTTTSGMPEGSHLQLDPRLTTAQIQGWGCTGACLVAARAMQRYGMYLIDTAGHPKVYFEDESTAGWNGKVTASTTNPIPLSDFRVVDG